VQQQQHCQLHQQQRFQIWQFQSHYCTALACAAVLCLA
jgi:hypothetical protein